MKNLFDIYLNEGKMFLGIAQSRDEFLTTGKNGICYGRKINYFTFSKTPGAIKTKFKKSKNDMVNLKIYKYQLVPDLSNNLHKIFVEIFPINGENTGVSISAEMLDDLIKDRFNKEF